MRELALVLCGVIALVCLYTLAGCAVVGDLAVCAAHVSGCN